MPSLPSLRSSSPSVRVSADHALRLRCLCTVPQAELEKFYEESAEETARILEEEGLGLLKDVSGGTLSKVHRRPGEGLGGAGGRAGGGARPGENTTGSGLIIPGKR